MQLQRLVSAEHTRRLAEPTARPLLVFSPRLRQLWSGEVPVSAASSTTRSTVRAGGPTDDAVAAAKGSPPKVRRAATPTLTVWQALLSPGRVAFGTTVCFSRSGPGTTPRSAHGGDEDGGRVQRRSLTAWEHPALQTPSRFEAVPLPNAMSTLAGDGRGLWAWAPVPRSEAFLAIGLVFTGEPEPPSLTDVRCVRKELVIDAEPQKCKVRTSVSRGLQSSIIAVVLFGISMSTVDGLACCTAANCTWSVEEQFEVQGAYVYLQQLRKYSRWRFCGPPRCDAFFCPSNRAGSVHRSPHHKASQS